MMRGSEIPSVSNLLANARDSSDSVTAPMQSPSILLVFKI